MYRSYRDIIDAVGKPPLWWVDGVPRFEPFTPRLAINYGREVALVHCRCQCCGFRYDIAKCGGGEPDSLREYHALYCSMEIGDPPNFCCSPGHATSVEEIEILQFWYMPNYVDWVRDRSMELPCYDHPQAHASGLKMWPQVLEEKGLERLERLAIESGDLDAEADVWRVAGYQRPRAVVAFIACQAALRGGESQRADRRIEVMRWLKETDER